MGLYRYKRLIIGVNSAAEVFQDTLQTVFKGIKGAKNISEVIIFHGREEEEHDQALAEILKMLHQSDLCINRRKCEFKLRKIKYYGSIFTQEGIPPAPWRKPLAAASHARPTRIEQGNVNMFELHLGPWVDLSIDFCDPLATGEYLLVIPDEYSQYPVVEVIWSTSAKQ